MSVETKLVTGVDFVCVPTQDIPRRWSSTRTCSASSRPSAGSAGTRSRWAPSSSRATVTIALLNTGKLGVEFQTNNAPIAFQVDDVKAARAELESRGVTFVADDIDSGVCHMAYFKDPDGNALMLHNRYAPKDARPEGMG